MNIQELREKYPQYREIDDEVLSQKLYEKSYVGKIDYDEFRNKFLMKKTGVGAALGSGIDMVQGLGYRAVKGFTETGEDPNDYEEGSIGRFIASKIGQGGALATFADKGIKRNLEEQQQYSPTVKSYKDVDSIGSAASYVGELTAQSLPIMAASLNPTGLFALGGGMSNEAYEAQEEKQPVRALVSGYGQAGMEKLGALASIGKLNKLTPKTVKGKVISSSVVEGSTEVSQDLLAQWGAGKDVNELDYSNLDESFVGGAAVGGTLRGGAEVYNRVAGNNETVIEPPKGPSVEQQINEGGSVDLTDNKPQPVSEELSGEQVSTDNQNQEIPVQEAPVGDSAALQITPQEYQPSVTMVDDQYAGLQTDVQQPILDGPVPSRQGDFTPAAEVVETVTPEQASEFAPIDNVNDETALNVSSTGKPFATKKALTVNKKYKEAVANGEEPTIVEVDGGFAWESNNYSRVQEAPVSELKLSKDIPQFKSGSNDEGVVEPLTGTYDPTGMAPIQVWVRKNGDKEIITGRHRYDLAKRSGVKTMPAEYHYEDSGFTADDGKRLDAILNIRDDKGKVEDYVELFQQDQLTEEDANELGLLDRAIGRTAYKIATSATNETIEAQKAGRITDQAAQRIAEAAPKDQALQALGVNALVNDDRTIAFAENLMRAVSSMRQDNGPNQETGDMFGFDDSAMREAEEMAKAAAKKQREIRTRLSAIRGAAKNPKVAAAEGIDIRDPQSLNNRISELTQEVKAWDNWHTKPELVAELRGDTQTAQPVEQTQEVEPAQEAEQEVDPNQGSMFGDEVEQPTAKPEPTNKPKPNLEVNSTKPVEKPANKPSLETKLADKKKEAAEELKALLQSKKGTLNSGIDPEVMLAVAKVGAYTIAEGTVKFAKWARDVLSFTKAAGIEDSDVLPHLKEAYGSIAFNPEKYDVTDELADQMDSPRVISKLDINSVIEESNENDQRVTGSTEPDSKTTNDKPATENNISDEGRNESGSKPNANGTQSSGQGNGTGVRGGVSSTTGKPSNKPSSTKPAEPKSNTTGSTDSTGSMSNSTGGLLADESTGKPSSFTTEQAPSQKPTVNKPALNKAHSSADLAQVKAQMPFLTDGQADDVVFAEKRLTKEDGYGVLFTNGTGTGKTFSGLGIVKRYLNQGKGRILILAPRQPIVDGWVKAGRDFFDIPINVIKDAKDAGEGVVITTYANQQQNLALVTQDFDLIVADEAHYFSQDQKGTQTKALKKARAIAKQNGTGNIIVEGKNPNKINYRINKAIKKVERLEAAVENGRATGLMVEQASNEVRELYDEKSRYIKEENERIAKIPKKDRPRAVFLSATPFAYEKNVVLGQGFLFDWNAGNEDNNGASYNSGSNFDQFMMQHFGYRMRYNKLTAPESDVDSGLMQRAFNKWLIQEGVLSGRMLDSDFDYDRKFVTVESLLGNRIDEALDWLWKKSSRDDNRSDEMNEAYEWLNEEIKGKFSYHERMYMLEAIKAKEAMPYIKEHLNAGRKVLVLHDLKKGGTVNPFIVVGASNQERVAYREFADKFGDVINSFDVLPSPISAISREFPDALIYNGDVTGKKRVAMQQAFNSDDPDSPRLILGQGDAMREGVSVHDTTGKNKRVLIHLGLPVKPTASIQQEGRIYRTGQASNTMFRYFTIGTNWERSAFATIAKRAGTAENLAMGEQARGLKDSFILAYEKAGNYPVNHDGEGTGGKDQDRQLAQVQTPWDFAIASYFGTPIVNDSRGNREGFDYFATPEPVGFKMIAFADPKPNDKMLEPSAGHGAIARWMPENVTGRAIEDEPTLASKLAIRFTGDIITGDFLQHNIINKYDSVVMNPPYGVGGKVAAEHVEKALKHVRDGGRVVALIPTGPAADKRFDKLLYDNAETSNIYMAGEILLPRVTFKRAGTKVSTRIIVLEKQNDPENAAKIRETNYDLTGIEDIKELFKSLENIDMSERVNPNVKPEYITPPAQEGKSFTVSKMDSRHTKTEAPLYVVNFTGDMGDDYDNINSIAKEYGGYYIRARMRNYYKPADGGEITGTPTFTFNTEEDRDKFIAKVKPPEIKNNGILFNRSFDTVKRGVPVEVAKKETEKFLNYYKGADGDNIEKIITDKKPSEIFGPTVKADDNFIKGAYDKDTNRLFIFAQNHKSVEDVRRTLREEIIVHKGISFFKDKEKSELLNAINETRNSSSKAIKDIWKDVNDNYADKTDIVQAEEFLGKVAQDKINLVGKYWNKVVAAIMKALRRAGLVRNGITMSEMRSVVYEISDYLRKPNDRTPPSGGGTRLNKSKSIDSLRQTIQSMDGVKTISLFKSKGGALKLQSIIIDKDKRKTGIGTKVMQMITDYADLNNLDVQLSPAIRDDYQGTTSKTRLTKFYKRFGFIENKGRNKDFSISESMYRKPLTNDVRFNRQAGSFQTPTDDRKSWSYWKRKVQDKFLPLKEIQATIADSNGQAIEETQDVYLAEELYYGKTEQDLNKMQDNKIKPLTDAMLANDINSEELDLFLIAKHAPERNEYIASINPEMEDGGSGMTNAEAEQVMAQINAEGRMAAFNAVAQKVYDITGERRRLMRENGLETDEMMDILDAGYEYYVPLKGFAEDSEGASIPRTGQGFDIRGSENMKAMGRRSKSESPVGHAIKDLTETIIRSRKNEVGKTLLNLVEANPNSELWEVFTDQNPDRERRMVNGEVKPNQPVDMRRRKDEYYAVKRDGKVYFVKFKDKDGLLIRAMKNMGAEEMNVLTKIMSAVTRWLSMVNTSLNPEFTVTNFSRDIQTALFNAMAEQDIEGGKVKGVKIAGKMVKGTTKAVSALYKHSRKTLDQNDEMYQWVTDFLDDGAKTGYFDSKDVNQIAEDLGDLLEIGNNTTKGKLLKAKKKVTDFVEHGNSAIENGVRLSAYIEARKAGVTRKKAASFAKNLTVNFNRKGEIGTVMNSLYMFFNAAIQGNANFARAILTPSKDPETGKRKLNPAQKYAMGISAAAFGLALYSREMGGEDEDGEPYWDKIPKGIRERNLIILKSLFGGEEGEYWKIPLPYGYNIFFNLGDTLEAAANSKTRKAGDLAAEMALSAYGSFIPFGSPVGDNMAESLLLAGIPTIGKPAAELAVNKNFYGGTIYRENMDFGPQKADAEMSMRSTAESYKVIAKLLNDVTGGDTYKSGVLDVSPDSIEHLVEFAFGGIYRFGNRVANNANTAIQGGDLEITNFPFTRQISGKLTPYPEISAFYDARQELKNITAQYKSLSGAERAKYRKENMQKLRLKSLMSSLDKRMKKLREMRDRIESDDSLTFKQREDKLDVVQDQMKTTVAAFNQKWNKTN